MTRPPSSCSSVDERDGLKKGPWTPDEDQKLVAYVQEHGLGGWRFLPLNAGLQRCGKSCRLRWTNYLRPDIKRGRFSHEEDQMIVHLHAILGNRWSAIASHIPRRTDNEIKNYWNTHLKKRLEQMRIDPVTHKSTSNADEPEFDVNLDGLLPGLLRPVVSSKLTHMSQWENARAEAEARLRGSAQGFELSVQTATAGRAAGATVSGHQPVQFDITPKLDVTPDTPSASFMSSWKARVAATLRPNFGVVEVEKTTTPGSPVNLQKFLQEWDSSLQPHLQGFSGYDSPIDVPDLSSGTTTEAVSPSTGSPCETPQPCLHCTLPSSAQITERLLASRCEIISPIPLGSHILGREYSDSQASSFTFPGPDHNSSHINSPCVSSNTGSDSFDLLSQSLSLIDPDNHESLQSSRGSSLMFPSFWSRQQPGPTYFLSELQVAPQKATFNVPAPMLPAMLSHVGVPNNIPIPQFQFLC